MSFQLTKILPKIAGVSSQHVKSISRLKSGIQFLADLRVFTSYLFAIDRVAQPPFCETLRIGRRKI